MVKAIPFLEWDPSKKTKETIRILAIGTLAPDHAHNHVPAYGIDKTTHVSAYNHVFVYCINKTTHAPAYNLINKIGHVPAMTHWYK